MMYYHPTTLLAFCLITVSSAEQGVVGWPAPARLRVEGLEQWPQQQVVLSEAVPRFSFSHGRRAAGAPRGLGQLAYRIVVQRAPVATSPVVVWNSGVVRSVNSSDIAYAGDAPLRPFESYT